MKGATICFWDIAYLRYIYNRRAVVSIRNSISSARILAEITRYIGIARFLFTAFLKSAYGRTRVEK